MRLVRLIPLVTAPLLLAAACTAPVARAAVPAAPEQQVLRVNVGALPSSLDPGKAAFLEDRIVANAIFAPLYRSAGGSSGALQPWLASGPPTVGAGGLRVTVRLRTARWSDGRPIRAGDVVLAFNRARTGSAYGGEFSQVRRAVAVDARTVRFELRAPVPWFGELLASPVTTPVPAHVVRKLGARWTRLDKIVTSGPFKPVSGRGRTQLLLQRSSTWWGAGRVRLQQLELLAVTQASASPLFRAGRLDVGLRGTSIHPSALATWRRDPRLRTGSTGSAHYLFLNTRAPALADARVRRAIALAIDRAAIAARTGEGVDQPLESIVPDGVRGFASVAPAGSGLLAADGAPRTAQAQALLADAGFDSATQLHLYHVSDSTFDAAIADIVRTGLAAAGVSVALHPTSSTEFAKRGIGVAPVRDGVDLVLAGWTPDYSDPTSFHRLFTCASVDAGLGLSNHCSADYDAAYGAALASTGAARMTAHRGLEQRLTGPDGAFPAVPLYEPAGTVLVQPWVHGFDQHPSGTVDFELAWVARH